MKVVLAINSLSTGGAEVFTAALARALHRAGCDVMVFLYAGLLDAKGEFLADQLRAQGIAVVTPNATTAIAKVFAVLKFARILRQFKPDVVHSHLEQSDLMVAIARLLVGRHRFRLVRTIHNIYAIKAISASAHKWLAAQFDVSVACGEVVSRTYPFMGNNQRCIENGVDIDSAIPEATPDLRRQLGVDENACLLMCVGSFDLRNGILQKAQDVVVEALARIETGPVYVCFLGDGNMRAEVEALAKSVGVFERCRFPGKVINVYRYLSVADAVLMPSRFEGLPIGAIEAACAGKPLVLSSIPQLTPFDTAAATVGEVNDPDALALAIDEMVRDLVLAKQQALALAPAFIERFGIDATTRQYLQLYRERGCPATADTQWSA